MARERRIDRVHIPVLADEVVRNLVTDREGAYIDLTAGEGGHLEVIAEALGRRGRIYGIDRDPEAAAKASSRLADLVQFRQVVNASYAEVDKIAGSFEDREFDGILIDLGISSAQVDDPRRGFSFRFEGPLDMRFDSRSRLETAAELIDRLDQRGLAEIISRYGEERNALRLAKAIVRERQNGIISTTSHLAEIVKRTIRPPHQTKSLARVFQALRIAVNSELSHLEEVLPKAVSLLKRGGRLAVIAYHSLEDRIVKQFFVRQANPCDCPPGLAVCVCGLLPRLEIITRRVIRPGESEQQANPRSRSARLRVARRTAQ